LLKKRKKNPAYRSRAIWVISLLAVAVLAAGWLLWRCIYVPSPHFNFILISVNYEPQKVLAGHILALHPEDKVEILKVSTNIFFDLGVRLVADGFDVSTLRYEETSLSTLLPNQEIFDHYRFRIRIKYRSQDLGYVDWEVRPYVEDWLEKVEGTIDGDQRVAILERAIGLLPEDRQLKQRLVKEYKSQKRWKKAATLLQKMAGKTHDRETLRELLEVYTAANNNDGVISLLKKLVKLDRDDLKARIRLAGALEKTGKNEEAIEQYEALLKLADKEDSLRVYKSLGYLYTKTGEIKKAISFYLKAAELEGQDENLYYNLSYLYEQIRQKEKADFYLDKAFSLMSGDVESRLKLAHSLVDRGAFEKAEEYLSDILQKAPKSLEGMLLMAQVAEGLGDKKKLKEVYKKLLSIDPENKTISYNLGALEYESGNFNASLSYLKKYVTLAPKDAEAHKILFDVYKRKKDHKMAFKEAQILLDLRPEEIDPYHFIFEYLHAREDYNKIISLMEKGLKTNPEAIDLKEYLALAQLKTGQVKPAFSQFKEILSLRPKDIDLLLRLARLLEEHGGFAEALEAYRKVIEISPNHEEAAEAYLRLRLRGVEGEGTR
jgi:tetratricopeptide (TPR) repeat protein